MSLIVVCVQNAPATFDAIAGVECGSNEHLPYIIVSAVLLLFYLPVCARFLRVGGDLSRIELDVRRPWCVLLLLLICCSHIGVCSLRDWSEDDVKFKAPRLHRLSIKEPAWHLSVVAIKFVLTAFNVFLSTVRSCLFFCYFLLCCVLLTLCCVCFSI